MGPDRRAGKEVLPCCGGEWRDLRNIASKLGEDIAGPGEILMAQSALQDVPEQASFTMHPVSLTIAGIELEAFSIEAAE